MFDQSRTRRLRSGPCTDQERGSAPSKPCPPGVQHPERERTWTRVMIVLGADTHKSSHTIAAVDTATGRVRGVAGLGARVRWPAGLGLGGLPARFGRAGALPARSR